MMNKYPAEDDEGCIEYKLKLSIEEKDRIEKIATQMKYRLIEGGGEAFYIIGVTDDGFPMGISEDEIKKTLKILRLAAEKINASIKVIRKNPAKNGYIVELFIRLARKTRPPLFITIPVLGNVDCGKSTLISVLCTGRLDDGKRGAMMKIARYLHEIISGRTSSISSHHLGFNRNGEIVNYEIADPLNEAEIFLRSNKIITFIDLAGHKRYLKTTVRGVTSRTPDYALLVVAANTGLLKMGREHLGISIALKIPIIAVITKTDITPKWVLKNTLEEIVSLLKKPGLNKIPVLIKNLDDIILSAKNISSNRIVPIFIVSNVTGSGLDKLIEFLNVIPPRMRWDERISEKSLMYIEDKFNVRGVGLVVSGLMLQGAISKDDYVQVGPFSDGSFRISRVKSIHINRINCDRVIPGQEACLALTNIDYNEISKGMVVLDKSINPRATREFLAKITILKHPTTIKSGYQTVCHIHSVRHTVIFKDMSIEPMRTGDTGMVRLKFLKHPWYIRKNDTFILRDSRTRALGTILELK